MTVDFNHGYVPPGVYINEVETPTTSSIGDSPSLVAFVGPSVGYQTNTEQVGLTDATVRFSHRGIDTASLVVRRVDTGEALVADTDYTFAQTAAALPHDYWVDLSRNPASSIDEGTPVWVSYQYTDPSFYIPKTFDNYEDVKAAFGEPLNLVPSALGDPTYVAVTSPLSLAAKIAFENGAGSVVLVATAPITGGTAAARSSSLRTNIAAAYDSIATDFRISVVVPVGDGIATADAAGVATDLKAHVESATQDGFYRTGVVGFDSTVATAPDTLLNQGGFRSKRIMLAFASPSGMQFWNGASNQTLFLGHQYLAAAYAGRLVANRVAKSLTHESLSSFSGIAGTPLSNALKNQYSAAGIAVAEVDRYNNLIVRHGVTTDPTNVNTRELAVVRARDAMISFVQTGIQRAGLIGQPIGLDTPYGVKSVVSGLLEHCALTGVIVEYQGLMVRQNNSDPSVIEVKYSYRPAYPLNYILVTFSINIATGDNTLTNTAA